MHMDTPALQVAVHATHLEPRGSIVHGGKCKPAGVHALHGHVSTATCGQEHSGFGARRAEIHSIEGEESYAAAGLRTMMCVCLHT